MIDLNLRTQCILSGEGGKDWEGWRDDVVEAAIEGGNEPTLQRSRELRKGRAKVAFQFLSGKQPV